MREHGSKLAAALVYFTLLICATGCCYRMPEDDEISLIPSTNNSYYTKEQPNQMPGIPIK